MAITFPKPKAPIKDFGRIEVGDRAMEYQAAAYHAKKSGTYGPFAWRDSMEGCAVGPNAHTSKGMRERHAPLKFHLVNFWCDGVGEDASSVQPRQEVTYEDCAFRGNRKRRGPQESKYVGMDKGVQVDGAVVHFIDCTFWNFTRAVRVKANSEVILERCTFYRCGTCVKADAMANPRADNPYDNGKAGKVRVTLIGCRMVECDRLTEKEGPGVIFVIR